MHTLYLFVGNIFSFYEQIWQIKLSILFCNCDSIKCDECDTFIRNKTSPSQFIGTFSITFHEAPIEKRVDILFSYVLFQGPWVDHTMIWEREDPPSRARALPFLYLGQGSICYKKYFSFKNRTLQISYSGLVLITDSYHKAVLLQKGHIV